MKRSQIWALCLLALVPAAAAGAEDVELDPVTGMKIAEDWELVRNHCIICHSPQQFLRQKGTKSTWTEIIRWMQQSGGLWKLEPEIESKIIGYLAANYQPDPGNYRRAPIAATQLPPNPYESDIKRDVEAKRKAGELPTGPAEP
jgi:mono/diheme cytochrome c family protein